MNMHNKYGETPLIVASESGHSECLEILTAAGATINECNKYGETALILAAENGHGQCVGILLKAGADLNQCYQDGITALMVAAHHGHSQCVKILLKTGADVNKCDDDGGCALIVSADNGHHECVKILLETGANVNQKNNDGYTALMRAACQGYVQCVKELIAAGADVNVTLDEDDKNTVAFALIGAAIGSQFQDSKAQDSATNEKTEESGGCDGHAATDANNDNNPKVLDKNATQCDKPVPDHLACAKLLVDAGFSQIGGYVWKLQMVKTLTRSRS